MFLGFSLASQQRNLLKQYRALHALHADARQSDISVLCHLLLPNVHKIVNNSESVVNKLTPYLLIYPIMTPGQRGQRLKSKDLTYTVAQARNPT